MDAGGVVGIVSLALQVSQGLAKYYGHFKQFDGDIATSVQRLERFHAILKAVEGPVRKLERDNDCISEEIRLAMIKCTDSLQKLEEWVQHCHQAPVPGKRKSRLLRVQERILFPFRRDALDQINEYLSVVQANLDTILHALNLDTAIRDDNKAEERTVSILHQGNHIRHLQVYQTELLESVDNTVLAQLRQSQLQNSIMHGHLEALSRDVTIIRKQHEIITTSLANKQFPPPSSVEESLNAYSSMVSWTQNHPKQALDVCTCIGPSWLQSGTSYWRFAVSWKRASPGPGSCVHCGNTNQMNQIKAQFGLYRHFMLNMVQLTMSCGRGAGGWSICSNLHMSRVMAYDNPAAVFIGWNDFDQAFAKPAGGRSHVLSYVKRTMDGFFRDGIAHPSDVTVYGESFLELAVKTVCRPEIYWYHSLGEIESFIQYFLNHCSYRAFQGFSWWIMWRFIFSTSLDSNLEARLYLSRFLLQDGISSRDNTAIFLRSFNGLQRNLLPADI